MKTGILTYYGVHNHGALLQANALKNILEDNGCQVSFLRFQRNYDMIPEKLSKKYSLGFSSIPFYLKYAFQKGINNIFFNVKKKHILKKYREKNILVGERYSDFAGDLVVIGSDEVFSLEIGINPFFFGHGVNAKRIFSYAGCFGPTDLEFISNNNLTALVESGLNKLCAVGVRDMNSKNIADSFCSVPSTLVCDPVILYGYKKEQLQFVPKESNYIVIYSYDKNMNDSIEIDKIREYARKHSLKLYSVGYYHKWCDRNINATPEETLGYIRNSTLVITDTFHGAVMSLVCEAQFVVKLRNNQNKLGYLMSEYDLENHIMSTFDDLELCSNITIDYNEVNKIMEQKRNDSLVFLRNLVV